ncbi:MULTISPECIES: hypothetical protein [Paenibacillus]|uniref:hypothetical protein n=1 Tax=Paenibacillus TaxID=44249 RepID=UPI0004ADE879|nr:MULTISPECIES: hypothetical protein [Paenibacillus]
MNLIQELSTADRNQNVPQPRRNNLDRFLLLYFFISCLIFGSAKNSRPIFHRATRLNR